MSALLTCTLLLIGPTMGAGAAESPRTESARLAAYVQGRMAATSTPGLAYAVVSSAGIEQVETHGITGAGQPITSDTPFLWGSVSKPVTATAVLRLVEDGTIELDEPVRTYLPAFTLSDAEAAARITVRQLLTHTSGIPEGTGITDRFEEMADPYAFAIAELSDARPITAPGEAHEYTSANYLVLGALVEEVAGRTFVEHLRDEVLEPLHITGAITDSDQADRQLPPGHHYLFGNPIALQPPYDPTGPSYGYLGGSVLELARFASSQLPGADQRVLMPASIEAMQTGNARVGDTQDYGFGWRVDDRNADLGTRTIWHGGAVHGYQTMLVLLPERDRAVVLLQNAYGAFQDADLVATGLGLARLLAGGEPAEATGDPTYPVLLAVLAVVLAVVLLAIGWAIRDLRRSWAPKRGRAGLVAGVFGWGVGSALVFWSAVVAGPAAAGAPLDLVLLWAPDIGGLLMAVACGAVLLGALRIAVGIRQLRPQRALRGAERGR